MKRYLALLSLVLMMAAVAFTDVGKMYSGAYQAPGASRMATAQLEPERAAILPDGYVSASDDHKLVISSDDSALYNDLKASGTVKQEQDYGSFRVLTVDSATMSSVQGRVDVRDDMNVVTLNGYFLDTTNPQATLSTLPPAFVRNEYNTEATGAKSTETGLYIVQFSGPVQDEWFKKLGKTGVRIVSYVASNGYVVEANSSQVQVLQNLHKGSDRFIQYVGAYEPAFRTSSSLRDAYLTSKSGVVDITVQVVNNKRAGETITALKQMAQGVIRDAHKVMEYQNITLTVPVSRLAEISQMHNVFGVERYSAPHKMDERQGQIMAGNISGNTVGAPGYLSWLTSKGFSGTGQFGFVVDISDDGLDKGSTTDVNNEFKVNGSSSGASRVTYIHNYTGDSLGDGGDGHGNLNASIIFGYNTSTGSAFQDAGGFNYGMGICPWVQLGATKIFSNGGTNAQFTDTATNRLRSAYNSGARISSNSWGEPGNNTYNSDSQEHDAIVRDADSGTAGNQEMTIVFAAGNSGPGVNTVSPPATGKNVICVAAFENDRQTGTDGCAVANSGADNVNDVINFSSRGPCSDGRTKPDIGAPGTHIQGAASRSTVYNGSGVCDKYWPTGQTLYAWSSGTSHSTPGTAGSTALVRQYFVNQGWTTPSPAMTKAYLTNSARYMTGVYANDTLPSQNQGMGEVNMGTAFDGAARVMVDQSQVLGSTGQTYTTSGTISDSSKPFRVSMAYTDAPGPTTGNAWVNNLDLTVTVGGTTYKGNVFSGKNSTSGGSADTKNNLESVFLPAGTTGSYTVTVTATNIAGDGVPGNADTTDQDFALVIYNATSGGSPTPDFSLSASPASQSVVQGSPTSYTATVGSINSFTGTVALTASGLPSGASASFSPASVTLGAGTSTMSVTTGSTTPAGNYTINITGTSGSLSHSTSVSLTVTPTGGGGGGSQTVTYSATPGTAIPDNNTTGITSTINVPDALTITSVSCSVNITHTWRGDLKIDLVSPTGTTTNLKATSGSDSADNVIATYTPTAFAGQASNGNWQLKVADLAAQDVGTLNSWSITITGTTGGGGGTTGDFSISFSPTTGSWTRGSSYVRTVSVTRTGGLTDPITLSYSASKTGLFSSVSASVNPLTTSSTSSVLTFRVATTAPTGAATVTVIGTDSSGRQRTKVLSLTIF